MKAPALSTWLLPACVLAVAAALRFSGLGFGLPMAEARPDELTIAFQAMKFGTGDLNPHSFNYPSLHKYLMFGLFGGYYVVGRALGWFAGQEEFLRLFFDGAVPFRLLMRGWSATMGVVGVGLLFAFPHGRLAAILLAVAFLHVRDSHFGVTDLTMVTLVTATVLAALRLQERGRVRDALLAGLLAGLATSTKYNAAVVGLPLVLAALLPAPAVEGRGPADGVRRAALGVGAMGAGFVAGTPYAVLDAPAFLRDFGYELNHLSEGHHVDIGNGWVHHLGTLLLTQGDVFVIVAVLGMLLAARLEGRQAAVLYSFPLVYWLLIGRGETAFFRYILPVVPFLCLAAARALGVLRPPPLALVGLLLLCATPLARSVAAVKLLQAGDTRDAMGSWIEAHVPTDATIVHAGTYTGAPMLQRNVANQTREHAAKAGRADAAGFRSPDDLTWYNLDRPMYDVWLVAKAGIDYASTRSVEDVLADPPPYLLLEDYFLTHYSAVPDAIRALARDRYVELHVEAATDGPVDDPAFDQQDALYLPAARFQGFVRMGPTLHLYQRKDP